MPPGGGAKRKRGSGSYSTDDGSRPSPYRPEGSNLAHHGPGPGQSHYHHGNSDYRGGRGGRGRGRGRGGMGGGPRSPDMPNGSFQSSRGTYGQHHHQQYSQQQQQQQQQSTNSRPSSRPGSQQSLQQTQQTQQTAPKPATQEPQEQPASTPVVAEPAPVIEVDENFDEPEGPVPAYPWEYVLDEQIESWEEEGRVRLLAKATEVIQTEDQFALSKLFLELLRSAMHGRLHPSQAGSFIKDILAVEVTSSEAEDDFMISPTDTFLDTVSMLAESDKKSRRLAVLLYRTEISSDTMRLVLDSDLLITLNLVRPTFNKAFIRHQTNVLYRQSNYNLLREETEGYSKLLTELFTTSEDEMPSADVVKATFERVRSMIGTFDLDVGRTLDVTLDVFAAVIVKHHRFFVKFLRDSSWWPQEATTSHNAPTLPHWALPDSNGVDALSLEEQDLLDQRREARDVEFWKQAKELHASNNGILAFYKLRGLELDFGAPKAVPENEEDRKWQEITGTDPPVGNKVAAQILGFKLRYYSSKARDSNEELPMGLVHLTALLIKIGFISLRDIYPHLWPEDASMEQVREKKEQEKVESDRAKMPGAAMNALAMAGALTDDSAPATRTAKEAEKPATKTEEAKDEGSGDALPDPRDSKIELLKALLSIGAIPDALYMLGRFPWMLNLVSELPDYIHRLLHHSLTKLYDPMKPIQDMSELRKPGKIIDPEQAGVPKGHLRRIDKVEKRTLRWLHTEQYKEEESVHYRYYWDDWSDNVPVCQTMDDFFILCDTFVNLSGVKIGQDPLLLTKMIRLGTRSLKEDASDSNRKRWIDLCKKLLVPALSLTSRNPGIMNEIYDGILRKFPVATRYMIYAEWYLGPTCRLPAIATAFKICEAETKGLLRRVSKANVKESARPLAKISTSSPGVTFQVSIGQMENYPVLVECFVESARFLTDLGYDVLAWCTLNSLARQGRDTSSADGLFTSKWLQSLGDFCGRMIWRYKMFDPDGIFFFLDRQLAQGRNNYLKVLDDIIRWMSGIRELTYGDNNIILAMSGGPLLQAQTLPLMQDNRHERRPTAERLRQTLTRTKTIGSLLLGLANECQSRLQKVADTGAPMKLQGNVHDEMFVLFYQYCDFLRSSVPQEQFERWIPTLPQLINDFGIDPRLAFFISRQTINIQMDEYESTKNQTTTDDSPAGEPGEEPEKGAAKDGDAEMTDSNKTDAANELPWNPVLKDLADQIKDEIGPEVLSSVGDLFYMSFWQLSLEDMVVPSSNYEEEMNRQKDKIREINQDRTDLTIYGTKKREQRRSALNRLLDSLREERTQQMAAYNGLARSRIAKEKEYWFAHTWGKHETLNAALLEHCFIPRMVLSPLDALYCFRMLKLLHSTGAKNFRTMGFMDQFFNQKRLTILFFMCSSKEAANMARFINEVLKMLGKWHGSQKVYESEAYGSKGDLTGFCRRIGSDKSQNQFLGYAEFRRLLFKWHGQLANALRHCLESSEYMHIRNAISILAGVVTVFPAVDMQAKKLLEAITAIQKSDPREDLKLASLSLVSIFKNRERNNEFAPHASFHQINTPGVAIPISGPARPEPGSRLNANASEFKPSALSGVRSEKPEPEDGEINSPIVAEAPRQAANGVKASATSNLAKTVENSDSLRPSDKSARSRTDAGSRTGTPKPESRNEGRPSPAPSGVQQSRDQGRLNGRVDQSRAPHALPQRPENSIIAPRRSERGLPGRADDRSVREPRVGRERDLQSGEYPRSGRLGDVPPSRSLERPTGERGHERNHGRLPPEERERAEPPRRGDIHGARPLMKDDRPERSERPERPDRLGRVTPRDERPPRDLRDRLASEANREPLPARGRLGGDNGMAPPTHVMNPERARLLSGPPSGAREDADDRSRPSRHSTSRPGSERGSRAASPVRKDEQDTRPPRIERHPHSESHHNRAHPDERRPVHPRAEREPYIGHDDRSRGPPRLPPQSDTHSRPPRDYGPPPGESQYGRLNGPDPTPTGPRVSGGSQPPGRLNRAPSGPATQDMPERSPLERQAPSGPASIRHTRSSGSFSRPSPASLSAVSTPTSAEASVGVHPDRAARLGLNGQGSGAPNSPVDAPRGPSSSTPTGPGRLSMSSQTGPPSPIHERGRGDKRFAGINTTLQQSGGQQQPSRVDQGASIRGRGARNPPPSPLGPGPTLPSGPGRHDGPPRDDGSRQRNDLFGDSGPHNNRGRDINDQRPPRRTGRSASPPGQRGGPRQPGLPVEEPRPPQPPRRDSRDLRGRVEAPLTPQGPLERETRRGRGDDYGSGKDYSTRHGGDRRDVRDIPWGGEQRVDRSDSRGGPPGPPDGPGSGRKRRGEYEDVNDPKRNRRGR